MVSNKYAIVLFAYLLNLSISYTSSRKVYIVADNDLTVISTGDNNPIKNFGHRAIDPRKLSTLKNINSLEGNSHIPQHTLSKRSASFTKLNTQKTIQDEIRKMKDEIEKLKSAIDISNEDKLRLAALETSIESLNRMLDDAQNEDSKKMEQLRKKLSELENNFDKLMKELENLKNAKNKSNEDNIGNAFFKIPRIGGLVLMP